MNEIDTPASNGRKSDILILAGLSLSLFLYHIMTGWLSAYGYFIDELYYIACSRHLAAGYVDHPPLSVLLLAGSRWLLGEGLPQLRLLPALAASATVFLTGIIARRLGGNRLAVVIAALAVMASPVYLLMCSFYSMNAFEPLLWTGITYFTIRLVQEEEMRYWLVIGVLMGIGLETKHTMAVYGAALISGMLLTGTRRLLWNRWVLAGAISCLLILIPNIAWQYANGFPSLEFYRNALANKNIPRGTGAVLLDQVVFSNPFALPVWIGGIVFLFARGAGARYRFFALSYLVLLGIMIMSHSSRPDRIGSAYTVLFAAGAVAIERLGRRRGLRALPLAVIVMLGTGAAAFAPIMTPLLPPPAVKSYMAWMGVSFSLEKGKINEPIPQWLADRLGWRELSSDVAAVYHSLPPGEQKNAVILSTNYGEAGALDLYGPEFGLPRVYATHNSYHLWGPPPDSARTYIVVFARPSDLNGRFDTVFVASIHGCEQCTVQQRIVPIYIARGPRFSIEKEWPNSKIFD